MKNRTSLTKSLHTVTAVSRVAAHLATLSAGKPDPLAMVMAAIELVGQGTGWASDDETVAKCIAATRKLMGV